MFLQYSGNWTKFYVTNYNHVVEEYGANEFLESEVWEDDMNGMNEPNMLPLSVL